MTSNDVIEVPADSELRGLARRCVGGAFAEIEMMRRWVPFVFVIACGDDGGSARPDAAVMTVADSAVDAAPDAALGSLTITLDAATRISPRAIGVEVDVTITRDMVLGDVLITATGLPSGVTAETLTLANGATTGTFVLWVTETATLGSAAVTIVATATSTETASTPLALELDDSVAGFDASWSDAAIATRRELHVVPGFTLDHFATLTGRNGYDAAIEARWTGLPTGATSSPVADVLVDRATLLLEVGFSSTVTPGSASASLVVSDGNLRQQLSAAITIMNAPTLDATIGTAGLLSIATTASAVAADLDSSNRLVAIYSSVGDTQLRRFTSAGALDSGWGTPSFSGCSPRTGIVLGTDAVIVAGSVNGRACIARTLATGALDTSFSSDGIAVVPGTQGEHAAAVRVRGGKFIYVGSLGPNAVIARLTSDGALDTTFNGTGRSEGATGYFVDFVVDANGRFVAAGAGNDGLVVTRFNADGTIDSTFGTNGTATLSPGTTSNEPGGIVEAANGDLIVAGTYTDTDNRAKGFIARLDSSGELVTSFGVNGVVTVSLSNDGFDNTYVRKVQYGVNGITIHGVRNEELATGSYAFVARFTDDGLPVTTFGTGGFTWLLDDGTAPLIYRAARTTPTGIWILARDAGTNSSVLMRLVTN